MTQSHLFHGDVEELRAGNRQLAFSAGSGTKCMWNLGKQPPLCDSVSTSVKGTAGLPLNSQIHEKFQCGAKAPEYQLKSVGDYKVKKKKESHLGLTLVTVSNVGSSSKQKTYYVLGTELRILQAYAMLITSL